MADLGTVKQLPLRLSHNDKETYFLTLMMLSEVA